MAPWNQAVVIAAAVCAVWAGCARGASPEPAEARAPLAGLWTHLFYEEMPQQPRPLPILYPKQYGPDEQLVKMAAQAHGAGKPIVLDIERSPAPPHPYWRLDTSLDSPEEYARAKAYMLDRLQRARSTGAKASLWSRPSQNGLSQIGRPGRTKLRDRYEQRLRDAGPVLEEQDFLVVQLYFPRAFKKHTDLDWPVERLAESGEWFLRRHRELGKESLIFVSPTWQGEKGEHVPARWLEGLVTHFAEKNTAVCIWGGQRRLWDPEDPMCQTIVQLIARHTPGVVSPDGQPSDRQPK